MSERLLVSSRERYVFWQLVLGMCLLSEKNLLDPSRKTRTKRRRSLTTQDIWMIACDLFNKGKILGSNIVLADAIWIAELPLDKIDIKIGLKLQDYRERMMEMWGIED